MTNIVKGDILTLSDGMEYLTIGVAKENQVTYFYLAELSERDHMIYCKQEESGELVVVEDEEEIKKILPLIYWSVFGKVKEEDEVI